MALVKKELRGNVVQKGRLPLDPLRKFLKRSAATLTFRTGKRDVGMKGSRLSNEAAMRCSRENLLCERDERGGGVNLRKKYAGTVEDTQPAEMDRNGRTLQLRKVRDEAGILFRAAIAEELKSNVPGVGRRPAQIVRAGTEPRRHL